ncbi:hypothetical protein JTF08_12660 [Micrococcaceae bacterium RIT802]|nr:hypothetical protein [Micrococcaceae bacterium RIT 802]
MALARAERSDLDWTHGRGAEARGPAEAVLLAMAGRGAAAADLTGPGARILQERLTP